jgi:hypothetical protein
MSSLVDDMVRQGAVGQARIVGQQTLDLLTRSKVLQTRMTLETVVSGH